MDEIAVGLAAIVLLGAAAQWIGWRSRLPSILILIVFGFLAGPEVLGIIRPDTMFGDLLLPVVSISVAILLFEGALTLHWHELGEHRGVVGRLVTLGALVTWALTAVAARTLLGLEWRLAVLVGAILTVTGPTVVLPILRQVRPTGRAGAILKWEGILIDPVGAVLAVLVFEAILEGGGVGLAVRGVADTVLIGGVIGVAGALVLIQLLQRFWVPDHLHSIVALALALGAYSATNYFQHEGGLFTVTLMGVLLANQKRVDVSHILEFKENLRVLIISTIFILLAARTRLDTLRALDAGAYVFLAFLIVVVRPAAVFLCTARTNLRLPSRIFIASIAPRGVVAAAVTAVFSLELEEAGIAGAQGLAPIMVLVIVGTVAIYGLAAGPLAHRLGLAEAQPQGVLFVGAQGFVRALARALQEASLRVRLVDTNALATARARMEGLPVYHGSALSEGADAIDLAGIGRLFAMTPNDEVNALCANRYRHVFGRGEVYQVAPSSEDVARHLRARILFGEEITYAELERRVAGGAVVKATPLTDQFGLDAWRARYGPDALPLLVLRADGKLVAGSAKLPLAPVPGETLIGLVTEPHAAA